MSTHGAQLRQNNNRKKRRCGYATLIVAVVVYVGWFTRCEVEDCDIEPIPCPPCPPKEENAASQQDVVKPTFPFRLRIVVFTYNRIAGLRRILASLVSANYPPEARAAGAVSLHIFIDFPKKSLVAKAAGGPLSSVLDGTRDFLDDFEWPHGPMKIHRREVNMGLKRSIMEGWYPTKASLGDTPEFCAFFEDDIEVSRHWFTWTDAALRKYAGVGGPKGGVRDPKLLGLSLFPGGVVNNIAIEKQSEPFILQQARSWGVVYTPWLWREFRQWYADLSYLDEASSKAEDGGAMVWSRSGGVVLGGDGRGIATLGPLMRNRGWYVIYPPSHLPGGKPDDVLAKKVGQRASVGHTLYNHDADAALTNPPPLRDMQAFDVMFRSKGKGPSNLPNYRKKSTSNV